MEATDMIDLQIIENNTPLLNEDMKVKLGRVLCNLESKIILKAIVDLEDEKSMEMAIFLKTFATLGENLELELYSPKEACVLPELDAKHLPVTGLYKEDGYGRAVFHGIPGGKEINAFIAGIYNLSGAGKDLEPPIMNGIAGIKSKANVKVFVALACHHCAATVTAAQYIAVKNSNIEAVMIDVSLYPDYVSEYKIEHVPTIILNDDKVISGSKTIEELIEILD